jgi:hypothetical protein
MKYYTTAKIDKKDATYNVIFGERSNGKTFALLKKSLTEYAKTGGQFAYVRRWKEDITGRRASQLFTGINNEKVVEKLTRGEFKGVHYHAGKFYLCNYDEKGKAVYSDLDIVGYTFALSDGEHDKSTSFPNVKYIIFDEFLSNRLYLNDEFVFFMNTVSTIVRKREDVKVYMLGNTVNKYSPYFEEMGLTHIQKMEQGTIDVYHYGESKLTVAVEYCPDTSNTKESNKYFAFNNPKLSMITGGAWELSIYPHLPFKYKPKHVLFTYFIEFSDQLFQCEIIGVDDNYFTFIHPKTTPVKDKDNTVIYTLDYNPAPCYQRNIYKPRNKTHQRILWFFKNDRVYYQSNSVGDTILNYLKVCKNL